MQTDYVVRVQGDFANLYSLGEVVIPGVAYFRNDNINLTEDQLSQRIAKVKANGGRIVK